MNNVCKLFTEEEAEDLLLSLADIKEVSDLYDTLYKIYKGYDTSSPANISEILVNVIEEEFNEDEELYKNLGITREELKTKITLELNNLTNKNKSIEENANKKVDHDRELSIDDNGLSLIFKNSSDITSFISFIKSKIISATIYNKDAKKDIVTIDDLNDSIFSLQNILLKQLARSLGIEEESMYDKTSNGYKLNENFFKKVMNSARVRYNLNKDSETGLYDLSSGERSGFFTYLLLSNFDDLISKCTQE